MRRNKGITLIALVITIIVLLILAGVAISMLSGENGILRKAADAKTKTEEGQKQEETALASMELEMYFQTTNSKYKSSNGYITGIEVGKTVSELQSALPDGYIVKAEDETDNFIHKDEDGQPIITTGLTIQKDGKTIARTIIYGDAMFDIPTHKYYADGKITAGDMGILSSKLSSKIPFDDIEKIVFDVNHDNIVDWKDVVIMVCYNEQTLKDLINQKVFAQNAKLIKIESYNESRQNWVNNLNNSEKVNFEWSAEYEEYLYTTKSITVEEIEKKLQGIKIVRGNRVLKEEEIVTEGDLIKLLPNIEKFNIKNMLEIGIITITE